MYKTEVNLPTQHVRMALRALSASPEFLNLVVEGTGLTPQQIESPHFRFPASALWPISENVARLLGPGWFLNFPALWSFEVQSEFGLGIRSAPNLGSAIAVITEFAGTRWPIGTVKGRCNGAAIVLEITSLAKLSAINWQFASSMAALNFQTVVNSINPDIMSMIKIRFKADAPDYAKKLNEILLTQVSWGHSQFEIEIPIEILNKPSNFSDDYTFSKMLSILRRENLEAMNVLSIKSRVLAVLHEVKKGRIRTDAVASALGLSARTLERRLVSEGTSLRELQEESLKIRFHEAIGAHGNATAGQIAFMLGYNDAASLSRACKRWFGTTFQIARREFLRSRSTPAIMAGSQMSQQLEKLPKRNTSDSSKHGEISLIGTQTTANSDGSGPGTPTRSGPAFRR